MQRGCILANLCRYCGNASSVRAGKEGHADIISSTLYSCTFTMVHETLPFPIMQAMHSSHTHFGTCSRVLYTHLYDQLHDMIRLRQLLQANRRPLAAAWKMTTTAPSLTGPTVSLVSCTIKWSLITDHHQPEFLGLSRHENNHKSKRQKREQEREIMRMGGKKLTCHSSKRDSLIQRWNALLVQNACCWIRHAIAVVLTAQERQGWSCSQQTFLASATTWQVGELRH